MKKKTKNKKKTAILLPNDERHGLLVHKEKQERKRTGIDSIEDGESVKKRKMIGPPAHRIVQTSTGQTDSWPSQPHEAQM